MNRGFTLIEVLIALAIVAIALSAAIRAAGVATDTSQRLEQQLLASWLAQNRLASHLAQQDWPNPGQKNGEENYGGLRFHWQEQVTPTDNRYFRQIRIAISLAEQPQQELTSLVGYLHNDR